MNIINDMDDLFNTARSLFPAFMRTHQNVLNGVTGFYFAIHPIKEKLDNILDISVRNFGEIPGQDWYEQKKSTQEQIQRMIKNNEITSFQSENVEKKQFGGGIRGTNYFVAVNGGKMPYHLCQKFGILLLLMAEELTVSDYVKIKEETFFQVNESRSKNKEKNVTLSEF